MRKAGWRSSTSTGSNVGHLMRNHEKSTRQIRGNPIFRKEKRQSRAKPKHNVWEGVETRWRAPSLLERVCKEKG